MCAMPVLLLALLRDLFRLGRSAARLARNRRSVPLPQKNMTRATIGGFAVPLSIGFAAPGIPFRYPVATWALAGVGRPRAAVSRRRRLRLARRAHRCDLGFLVGRRRVRLRRRAAASGRNDLMI